jgi:hypothetical protein
MNATISGIAWPGRERMPSQMCVARPGLPCVHPATITFAVEKLDLDVTAQSVLDNLRRSGAIALVLAIDGHGDALDIRFAHAMQEMEVLLT